MFTGIIEALGEIVRIEQNEKNIDFSIACSFLEEIRIDQSIAHDGVCLTVIEIGDDYYKVTAVEETLKKSRLSSWNLGDKVNVERSMTLEKRLDGHMVQGHVDTTAECIAVHENQGSWIFQFEVDEAFQNYMVEKGSICINGTSLTIFGIDGGKFQVTIIPYTYHHTNIHSISIGDHVNIEFDITGKYIVKYLENLKLS